MQKICKKTCHYFVNKDFCNFLRLIFEKFDKNHHYSIGLKRGKICKDYHAEFNIVVAVNEFIRFFIMLDDFIINNDVIGHEENFKLN